MVDKPGIGRRRFLQVIGTTLGGIALGGALRPIAAANTSPPSQSTERIVVQRTGAALGAKISLTVLHTDRDLAATALDAALTEIRLVESVLSLYQPDSQLSQLNRAGVLDRPHPMLLQVLARAQTISQSTGGAFDVTVQPLWQAYAEARLSGRLPSDGEVQLARAKVGWQRVEVTRDRVRLNGEGMAITLNGIAQGYAADRVRRVLQSHGITEALIDTGEFAALGSNQKHQPWQIGLQHPRKPDAYVAMAALSGKCLATSGDYETTFSPDARHNHIFDPRTGRSPETFSSVSILADTAMDADALSTAVFVLGPDRGLKLIRDAGAEALCVLKDGTIVATRGFPRA